MMMTTMTTGDHYTEDQTAYGCIATGSLVDMG